ncbi:MAG: GGDEF domain-containing protein [Synergistaceae bacterium]|nr:GGDEF domain-containing protein [Synergistaceae bacterium]
MTELHIYSPSKKLITILEGFGAPEDLALHFHAGSVPAESQSVVISARIPESKSAAKYVLCSQAPQNLTPSTLEKLYDLWPMPLTSALAKFLFGRLIERIKSERANNYENIEHQKRILEMARQDYLTGLATRWYLQDFIERNRHERNITCVYFDLDNFKGVNDTFGHQAGDRALAATAEMMQREFPDGFCARMGGDEFMLVLLGKRDINDTAARVNEFMTKLLKYYACSRTMRELSVSAGISQAKHDSDKTIDQIIHEADRALYEAKKSGKSQCKIYSPSMG